MKVEKQKSSQATREEDVSSHRTMEKQELLTFKQTPGIQNKRCTDL
jgi:hypothetical protein